MKEIRLHGRGGQGNVIASQILVSAFVSGGGFGNSIPYFGFERRGAPTVTYVRLDDRKIRIKSQVYNPDCVVVLDPTVKNTVNVFDGLKGDGVVVLNDSKEVESATLPESIRRVGLVDATGIAIEMLGMPITNSPMLGAFAATTGWVSLESILSSMRRFFDARILEGNRRAAAAAYQTTRVVELDR